MHPGMMHVVAALYTDHIDEDTYIPPPTPDPNGSDNDTPLPWLDPHPIKNENGLPPKGEPVST